MLIARKNFVRLDLRAIFSCFPVGASDGMPVLALALGVNSFAAVLRPAGSPFMPLRCSHQAPGLRTG